MMKFTKYFTMLFFCLSLFGCDEPKQNTKPGEFGHYIYKQSQNNCVSWHIAGMYINDSLVLFGGPPFNPKYSYPIINIKTGNIEAYYNVKTNK